jgi:hypothetical protein
LHLFNVVEYAWWIVGAIVAAGTPAWLFVVLLRRVRRGYLPRMKAALLLLSTVLLPGLYIAIMAVLYGLAHLSEGATSIWTGDAGMVALGTTAILLGAVGVFNVVFWVVLVFRSESRTDGSSAT